MFILGYIYTVIKYLACEEYLVSANSTEYNWCTIQSCIQVGTEQCLNAFESWYITHLKYGLFYIQCKTKLFFHGMLNHILEVKSLSNIKWDLPTSPFCMHIHRGELPLPFVVLVLVATEQHAQVPALKKTTNRFFLASEHRNSKGFLHTVL